MKWTYSIKNKLLASVVLLALCLLVLLSNFLDRVHTENVKSAIVTLYEDRLIAEVYIYKMTNTVYEIREVLNSDWNDDERSKAITKQMSGFNDTYNFYVKTKLTAAEQATATELISHVKKFEQTFPNNNANAPGQIEKVLSLLNNLSAVQLEESKLIMKSTEAEYATIKISSQFAFAIIIIILLVLQAIVFSAKTIVPMKSQGDPTLN